MKNHLLFTILIISFTSHSIAKTIEEYKREAYSLILQSQKEHINTKKTHITDFGKRIEKDISISTYPTTERENEEMSWKVEISTAISILNLKDLNLDQCERIRIRLKSQMNSPTIETESTSSIVNDRQKLIQDLLEYLCYE